MPQEYTPLTYSPTNGINSEDSESQLLEGQVVDAVNIIFERKQARNRPFLINLSSWFIPHPVVQSTFIYAGSGVTTPSINTYILRLNDSVSLYQLNGSGMNPITGAGTGFSIPLTRLLSMVNYGSYILIAGSNTGFIKVDPIASTYTKITTVTPLYIGQFLDRVIGAVDLSGSVTNSQRTVFWSKVGDETAWLGSTDGSGIAVLNISDVITGMVVVKGVWVICRSSGFTFGVPTGQAFPAFTFQKWSEESTGFVYPDTIVSDDNIIFGVGIDNVYTFDLSNSPVPIGTPIRTQLLKAIQQTNYAACITRQVASGTIDRFQRYYHLFPNSASTATYPHFFYNIETGAWSKANYANPMVLSVESNHQLGQFTLVDSVSTPGSAFFSFWNSDVEGGGFNNGACEMPASITGPNHILGQPDRNAVAQRLIVRARDQGVYTINANLKCAGDGFISPSVNSTFVAGRNNDNNWRRNYVDGARITGQDFRLKLSIPANVPFVMEAYTIQWEDGGDFRG